jgi:catechol 2,3-dioxygenase-like lactoylglutathione lyase family enzyme
MTRLHLHVGVADLNQSIAFYSTLFGAAPSVRKDDYAKWMLEDPRVNFAISTRALAPGLDHVGIQTDDVAELADITDRLKSAGASTFEQQDATCCYAQSDKTWVTDPSGLRWETFHTHGEATTYGADASLAAMVEPRAKPAASSCCG